MKALLGLIRRVSAKLHLIRRNRRHQIDRAGAVVVQLRQSLLTNPEEAERVGREISQVAALVSAIPLEIPLLNLISAAGDPYTEAD
jgi:hypothetical protein